MVKKKKTTGDKADPNCDVHHFLMPDGHCTCTRKCPDCGTVYVGFDHDMRRCRNALRKQLKDIRDGVAD